MSDGLAGVAVELARAQLGAGRVLRTTARGHSMWPTVRDGQSVEVLPVGARAPRVGEVALVAAAGRLILHRVVDVAADGVLITKGDAVGRDDGRVATGAVLGVLAPRPWDRLVAAASRRGGAPLARVLSGLRRALEVLSVEVLCSGR